MCEIFRFGLFCFCRILMIILEYFQSSSKFSHISSAYVLQSLTIFFCRASFMTDLVHFISIQFLFFFFGPMVFYFGGFFPMSRLVKKSNAIWMDRSKPPPSIEPGQMLIAFLFGWSIKSDNFEYWHVSLKWQLCVCVAYQIMFKANNFFFVLNSWLYRQGKR